MVDVESRPDRQQIDLQYDAAGRLAAIVRPAGTTVFAYDDGTPQAPGSGNLASIAAPGGENLAFGYDGSLLEQTTWSGPVDGTVSRTNIDDDYLQPMMERTGLASVLDAWTSSEEARSCKPDPGIFELAMSKASVDAKGVLFVGDSVHHDVRGARRMGMRTVLIQEPGVTAPGNDGSHETPPDHTIEQLAELLPIARDHLPR